MIGANIGKGRVLPCKFCRTEQTRVYCAMHSLLRRKICVDLCNKLVSIGLMNLASLADRLASGVRTAKAVHADLKEELRCVYVIVKNITDKCIFSNLHFLVPFIRKCLTELVYHIIIKKSIIN